MKALITGGEGLLGSELSSLLPNAVICGHAGLDVGDADSVWRVLTQRSVDIVFHCAGVTNVDACEADPARARRVNAVGAYNVASVCSSMGICLVALSTDYVFDTKPGSEIQEDARPKPISVYGRSKLEGEIAIQEVHPNAAIVRTSWLYGQWKPTFIDRVIARAAAGEHLDVNAVQVSSPTWVRDLAPALIRLGRQKASGIFHLTGDGYASRAEWARAALESAHLDPAAITAVDSFPAAARRPRFSALANTRARRLGITLPPWRDALDAYINAGGGRDRTETVA